MGTIFTIGHGTLSIEEFVNELKSFGILFLVDVRSKPYSKWCPHFNQDALQAHLKREGIVYEYMGDVIGGLPEDRTCYTNDKVDYIKYAQKDFFKGGIARLETASQKEVPVAIMCSEKAPKMCHRYKLIGAELVKKDIPVSHIVGVGISKTQQEVEIEATDGWGKMDLFGEAPTSSRKRYVMSDVLEITTAFE